MTNTDMSKEREAFEAWARDDFYSGFADIAGDRVGTSYRDMAHHMAWYAFQAGRASLSANAGEPVAWLVSKGGIFVDSAHTSLTSANVAAMRNKGAVVLPLYLAAPPTAQAEGWTKASQQLPPCRDDQLYIGVNSAGYAGVFNAVASIAGIVHCMYETAEGSTDVMSDLAIWKPLNPPTSAEGVE